MKPGPEHVHRRFRHRPSGVIVAYLGKYMGSEKELISTASRGPLSLDTEAFDRDFDLLPGMPDVSDEPTPPPPPAATSIPALLARLLAAGCDDVELALRSTTADPRPSYRLIAYWKEERISWTQLAADEGDLGRIEAAVMEKLEERKAEWAAKGES